MSRTRLPILPHLPYEEVARRYHSRRQGREKTHWQVLWLLARPDDPLTPAQAAAQGGLTPSWVRTLLKRYNAEGPQGLGDRRALTNGGRAKLTPEQQAELFAALQACHPMAASGPARRAPHTSATVGAWSAAGRPAGTGCDGWASHSKCRGPATPRPPTLPRSRCGKDITACWIEELRQPHPDKPVELWAEDEARLGLKPIARRVWTRRGRRPWAHGQTKYHWLYVYGFVHPASGRNRELQLPRANTDWMDAALDEVARWAAPEGRKLLVLLVDNAGWHVAQRLAVPADVVLRRLPACTLELQPAEPLWPLVREAVANRGFADLEALEGPVVERCRWLIDHPEVVRGVVGFHGAVALNG